MIPIRVQPLPQPFAEEVRRTRADEHGNSALVPQIVQPGDKSPCRVCLEDARPGERLLLFSYAAITRPRPYRFVGPIFIHADGCAPYANGQELPPMLLSRLLSVRAFSAADALVEAEVMKGGELEMFVQRLFENPEVSSVHVHTARPGCFLCRIERA